MRVIAGSAKGRRLKSPPRTRQPRTDGGTRPSTDLVRGAMFSALTAMDADLSRVLDLYAGTGALGIEALSRGAGSCYFVERDRSACAVINENLAITGFAGRAQVHCVAAERVEDRMQGPFTLILADPPYADERAQATVAALASSTLAQAGATVLAIEHAAAMDPPAELGWFSLVKMLRHGDSAVSIYR